jgi:hypothetical protein
MRILLFIADINQYDGHIIDASKLGVHKIPVGEKSEYFQRENHPQIKNEYKKKHPSIPVYIYVYI